MADDDLAYAITVNVQVSKRAYETPAAAREYASAALGEAARHFDSFVMGEPVLIRRLKDGAS
jgi:hypothetical protein